MPIFQPLHRVISIAALLGVTCLGAAPAPPLPSDLAGDVAQSFRLLTTTYYETVTPQALFVAASAALATAARKHGVTMAAPSLQGSNAALPQLDAAIASTAQAANASPSEFAYVAIDAMAKATNDRYTQFFTPAEYRAFSEALDPQKIGGIGVMITPDPASGFVRVSYVLPGTPAERAGLQMNDVITAVNGTATKGLSIDGVSGLLRGKAGTVVNVWSYLFLK